MTTTARCPRCRAPRVAGLHRCFHCGHPTAVPDDLEIVDGRYRIDSVLGAGAMGIVYLARDVALDRQVALKMLAPELVRDPLSIERFQREAAALASIRNEHIVQIYAFGEHEGMHYFAMEYIRGHALEAVIDVHTAHGTFMPMNLAVSIVRRVASGLTVMHGAGQIHRDVKPANIVVEEGTGRAVLLDLGLARSVTAARRRQSGIVGSPAYIAPELIDPKRGDIGPASDQYSLACSAFEALTAHLPFDGASPGATMQMHLHEDVPDVSRYRADLAPLDRVLRRALAKHPGDRYPSCDAFGSELVEATTVWRTTDATMPPPPMIAAPSASRAANEVVVVIADDDALMRATVSRAVKLALRGSNLSIHAAASGDEAVLLVIECKADLVILDQDMPGMTGVEALTAIRSDERVESTPALIVSGTSEASVRWQFIGLGVTEIVAKPVRLDDLVEAVRRSLQTSARTALRRAT